MGKVSCVMAAHNAAGMIAEAIASVLAQTHSDLELIVVDDGSVDGTGEVAAAVEDERVVVVRQEHRGPSAARNRGIAMAGGEYLAMVDADDVWVREKLEWQVRVMRERPEVGMVYGWTDVVDEQLEFLHADDRKTVEGWVLRDLLEKNFISCGSNVLVRRGVVEAVGGFDEGLTAVEDWEWHTRVAARYEAGAVREVVVRYRKSPNSLSSRFRVMERSYRVASRKVFSAAPAEMRGLKRQAHAAFYRYLLGQARNSESTGGKWAALPRYAALAAWYGPVEFWQQVASLHRR